jgi:sialidase-1
MNLKLKKVFRHQALWCVFLFMICPGLGAAQAILESTTVWQQNENNIFTHFVYGLSVTKKGTILSFSEARIHDGTDHGAHHIVMKRSTDKGASFSASQILVKSENGQCWANPTALVENKTGAIFLFYALNEHNAQSRVFYKKSKNEGRSWSAPMEVTSLFTGNKHEWTFHLPGPGHGIQLKDGRLIVPIWHRKPISFPAKQRNYDVNFIYSDDRGKSWKLGGETPVGELNESQLVEKENGDLLFLGRTITGNKGAYQAKLMSKDRGITWSDSLEYAAQLTGRVCDIGMTGFSWKPNIMLVSQPSGASVREDLVIRMSTDGGRSWDKSKLILAGRATYSDLAVLPDQTVVCLVGKGGGATSPESVVLIRFNLEWLVEDASDRSKTPTDEL